MHNTPTSIRDQFCEDFVAYMRARAIAGKQARNPGYILDVILSVSRPVEDFWASIDVDLVMTSLNELGHEVPKTFGDYQTQTHLRQRI